MADVAVASLRSPAAAGRGPGAGPGHPAARRRGVLRAGQPLLRPAGLGRRLRCRPSWRQARPGGALTMASAASDHPGPLRPAGVRGLQGGGRPASGWKASTSWGRRGSPPWWCPTGTTPRGAPTTPAAAGWAPGVSTALAARLPPGAGGPRASTSTPPSCSTSPPAASRWPARARSPGSPRARPPVLGPGDTCPSPGSAPPSRGRPAPPPRPAAARPAPEARPPSSGPSPPPWSRGDTGAALDAILSLEDAHQGWEAAAAAAAHDALRAMVTRFAAATAGRGLDDAARGRGRRGPPGGARPGPRRRALGRRRCHPPRPAAAGGRGARHSGGYRVGPAAVAA